jgi:DNA-binding CsgD family transcriptional regulator
MERLRHSDYRRLLDLVAALQEPMPVGAFGERIVALMAELLPGATIAFDQIREADNYYTIDHNVPLDAADQARMAARLREVYRENPVYGYIQGGGTGPVVDIADLMPRRQFRKTDFYQDIFRPYGIEHQVNVLLSREGWINSLTINRDRAIDGRTKTMLALASRHIQLAHRQVCLTDRLLRGSTGETLTAREVEVFRWLSEGKRNSEIAIILGCSSRTIDKHVENILRKTGAETRTAAVRIARGE